MSIAARVGDSPRSRLEIFYRFGKSSSGNLGCVLGRFFVNFLLYGENF